ncbi:MAG: hypothetical protein LBQ66_08805 [Planctomycetaceae bacterium]|jgi:hypothetical protein|nr:hypothetical protein [Planctomycetaceae bacterium]
MRLFLFLFVLILFSLSGCQALRGLFDRDDPKPPSRVVSAKPTLQELIDPINRNSAMIRNISAEHVSLTLPQVSMPLNVRLTCERPKRVRIIGGTSITGRELDFGSNDELFWIWIKRENSVYFCRHAQFPNCPVRNSLPIEPEWLIEALGIIEFKDNELHEAPIASGDGNWIITTRRNTATGQFTKRTTIDAKTGLVAKQEIFSPQYELITTATPTDYRYDVQNGITYARKIDITHSATAGKISINLGAPQFNLPNTTNNNTYTMPTYEGQIPIDICSEEFLRSRNINITPQFTQPNQQPTNNTQPQKSESPTIHQTKNLPTTIPSNLTNYSIQNNTQPNNNIPTYIYNNNSTSQGTFQTIIK